MSNKKQLGTRWKNFRKNPEKVSEQTKEIWTTEEFTLMFHTPTFSSADVVLDQDVFSGLAEKDILEIFPLETSYAPFLVQVSSDSFISKTNITISISSQLASVLSLSTLRYLEIKVNRLTSTKYDCDELIMSIKAQHICRSHIWTCSKSYIGMALYKGQFITKSGLRTVVSNLIFGTRSLPTAVITKSTKFTFRSKSCKMKILIEMSKEMWEVSPSGILYWEKTLTFLTTCFERQLIRRVSHEIDVIIYARLSSQSKSFNLYRHILRITDLRNSWMDALKAIRREINFFPALVGWENDVPATAARFKSLFPLSSYTNTEKLAQGFHQSMVYHSLLENSLGIDSAVSISADSCFLEAINYSLNWFETEEIKNFTGNNIMVVSAGTGLYTVSLPLANVTEVRVLGLGVSVNVMSMKRHPLHKYPLFEYYSEVVKPDTNSLEIPRMNSNNLKHTKERIKPIWFTIHYFFSFMQLEATCNLQSAIHLQVHERQKKFVPLFRLANIPGDGLPHIKSKLSKEIIFDRNELQMTSLGLKFQFMMHDNKIFARTGKAEENSSTVRKWSIQRIQERSMSRRDSTESYRRESSVFVREPKKDSLLSGLHYTIPKNKFSSFKRRWVECYKIIKEISEETLKDENQINSRQVLEYYESVWSSILEPCLLPLYNDFWAKKEDLDNGVINQYYVRGKVQRSEAIESLICSRLDQGFQIVRKNAIDKFGAKITPPDNAVSLGFAYIAIIPNSNDDISLDYLSYLPKVAFVQASAQVTLFNTELKVFETKQEQFSFTYSTSWTEQDSKILGQ